MSEGQTIKVEAETPSGTITFEIPETFPFENHCDRILVSHKQGLFVLQLGQSFGEHIRWLARIWVDPIAYKNWLSALERNLEKYEEKFGEIKSIPVSE